MKKLSLIAIALGLTLTTVNAQNQYHQPQQQQQNQEASNSNGQTKITFTTLDAAQKEKADHWGMTEEQWLDYEKYMELEGNYFYKDVDPLTVMGLITKGEDRELFMAKQLMFERQKIKNETTYANDMWSMQIKMYGFEEYMDFRSLPWIDRDTEDWRLYKHSNTLDSLVKQQQGRQLQLAAERKNKEYKPQDELWVFVDDACVSCEAKLKTIRDEQPLNVAVFPILSNPEAIDEWVKAHNIESAFFDKKMRLDVFNKELFPEDFVPKPDMILQVRDGKIIREI